MGSSTDADHSLDIEVGGDVELSRADVSQGDKGAGKQGEDLVSVAALSDVDGDKEGRCA